LIIALILLWVAVFGWLYIEHEKELQEHRKEVAQKLAEVQQEQDEKIFDTQQQIIDSLSKRKSDLQQAIEDASEEWVTPKDFSFSTSRNQLETLESLYWLTQDESLLPALFEISLQLREFDSALEYLTIIQQHPDLKGEIWADQYVYALINSADISFESLTRLDQIVQKYHESWLIDDEKKTFYDALWTLTRGDLELYKQRVTTLAWGSFDPWHESYTNAVQRVDSFVDAPAYYLHGLLSIGAFQQGRYRPVQHISRSILQQDSSYLLAYQLNAYSSLMLSDWNEALQSLEYLKTHDLPNKELYLYLTWIVQYHQGRYTDAIFSFKQLKEQEFNQDVLRYLYVSYLKLEDKKWMLESLKLLINQGWLTVNDYYTIFDSAFFAKKNGDLVYIDALEDELEELLSSCYAQVKQDQVYVCLYGKAWLNLYLQEYDKAYQYLSHASQRFSTREIFELLWDVASKLDKQQEATKRYIKALTTTSVADDQDDLREKIRWLME